MTTAITARFKLDYQAFHLDVDLSLPNSGITVLFGESGSGKTTFLRCIAGLERAPQAYLEVNQQVWQDSTSGLFLPTYRRALGYVFQDAQLFPHLTVADNLAFGLKRIKNNVGTTDLKTVVELLGIGALLKRLPERLSGGERQRVAIARALVLNPDILLMDEPLASLDAKRKQEIMPFLKRLHQELTIPMLYVTHDQQEVAQLADTLVIMPIRNAQAGLRQGLNRRHHAPAHPQAHPHGRQQGRPCGHDQRFVHPGAEAAQQTQPVLGPGPHHGAHTLPLHADHVALKGVRDDHLHGDHLNRTADQDHDQVGDEQFDGEMAAQLIPHAYRLSSSKRYPTPRTVVTN